MFILPSPEALDHHNAGYHTLGYHISGKPSGAPIFYFHGLPSSRVQADEFDATAHALDLCVIGVDRPGVGLSTFQPDYSLLDWPHDIHRLATHLGLSTFRVFGGSGGGPYALACAHSLPEDVLLGTGVLAGVSPPQAGHVGRSWARRFGFAVNKHTPTWLLSPLLEAALARHARNPDGTRWRRIVVDGMINTLPAADHAFYDEAMTLAMLQQMRDACKSGVAGYVQDAKCVMRRWPFELTDVKGKVRLWNGARDTDTPVEGARWMAERLPRGSLRVFDGEGHDGVFGGRCQEEVLRELVEL